METCDAERRYRHSHAEHGNEQMWDAWTLEDEFVETGRKVAELVFRDEGIECVLIFSSMEIESVFRRNKKAATKKRLNSHLARAHKAYEAAMERLLARDYDGAQELIAPYSDGDTPSVWICFGFEEASARFATIYHTLSASAYPYDAFMEGGREHVATITFWLDR